MKMHRRQLVVVCGMGIILLLASHACAGEVARSLDEKEVTPCLKRLNSQGIIVTYDKAVKENKIKSWADDSSFFMLDGSDAGYAFYRVDINNDGMDEYVLCSASGSGNFFGIDAIYQEKDAKLVDIFNQIKIPMRKLVRDTEKESYDLEEGYVAFMNGSIRIEEESGKVYFTLEKVSRKYENKPGEDDYNPPQGYKFTWDRGGITLVSYYVGDTVYKP